MTPKMQPLNEGEEKWIAANIRVARTLANIYAGTQDGPLTPEILDRAYAGWLAAPAADVAPNDVINAVGIAFGQYVVDHTPLHWAVATDEHGTELAIFGQPGDVLIYPTNFVGKRYPTQQTEFLVPFYEEVTRLIQTVGNYQNKRPWWKLR